MKIITLIIFTFLTLSAHAQQWVWDEIAEEQSSSEPIPTWLIILLVVIGYFVFKHFQRKDNEERNKQIEQQKRDEQQRLDEELQAYNEQHEDDVELFDFDDIIVPNIQSSNSLISGATPKQQSETTPNKEISQLAPIETDAYIISANGKEFIKAKDVETIVIPDGVEIIKSYAFSECKAKSILLPKSVRHIEYMAFSGISVEKIIIPNSVEKFGDMIFMGNKGLKEVIFEEGIKNIGGFMFSNCWDLTNITLPQSLISIPDSTFDGCLSLKNINLPKNLKRIGDDAFSNCQSLEEIEIPSSVTDIGFSAFRGCALKKIVIPNSIYGISEYMFYENSNLSEVILPNTITCIMENAFYGCENLHIVIPASVSYIAPDAFNQCNEYWYENLRIEVPRGKKEKLEQLNEHLIGHVFEYDISDDMSLPFDLLERKKRFVDLQIFKEKENLRNQEPMFYYGAQVVFRYENKCTYDNFQ